MTIATQANFKEVYNIEGGISSFMSIADKSDLTIK